MKLLIIGGTGLLSSAVLSEALANGIDVTVVNRGQKQSSVPDGVACIKADYRNEELMCSKLAGLHFDAVIDFICFNRPQIEYSINLLHGISDQYVFISTTCVYNTHIPGVKKEDSEKVLKEWYYSVDKWDCECYLQEQSQKLSFNYTIIRPCVTYDDTRIPYGIMPHYGYHWTLCARILAGKPIIRWDKGTAKWNMMRVEDFAVGVVGLIGKKSAYNEAFNLSGDEAYEWNDVINVLSSYLGKEPVFFDISSEEYAQIYPDRKGEIVGRSLDAIVSNEKIKTVVPSYKSVYSLEAGLIKTLDAYKAQNYQKGIDWCFDAETDRIICDYCKSHGIDKNKYYLKFVDYLGTASRSNKNDYYFTFRKNNTIIKAVTESISLAIRLAGKIKRVFFS